MAFDVYAGTLVRYYRRDWENVVQRMAREQGMQYHRVAGAAEQPPPSAEEIGAAVNGWCNALTEALQPHGLGPFQWDERDSKPYYTDRPAWEGYSALLLWAAYTEFPEYSVPELLPEEWFEDETYQRAISREHPSRFFSIVVPQLWLPVEFSGVFKGPTLASEKPTPIGSSFALRDQLEALWTESGSQLAELAGQQETPPEGEHYLAHAAHHGIHVFRKAAEHACEHRVPILLDY